MDLNVFAWQQSHYDRTGQRAGLVGFGPKWPNPNQPVHLYRWLISVSWVCRFGRLASRRVDQLGRGGLGHFIFLGLINFLFYFLNTLRLPDFSPAVQPVATHYPYLPNFSLTFSTSKLLCHAPCHNNEGFDVLKSLEDRRTNIEERKIAERCALRSRAFGSCGNTTFFSHSAFGFCCQEKRKSELGFCISILLYSRSNSITNDLKFPEWSPTVINHFNSTFTKLSTQDLWQLTHSRFHLRVCQVRIDNLRIMNLIC